MVPQLLSVSSPAGRGQVLLSRAARTAAGSFRRTGDPQLPVEQNREAPRALTVFFATRHSPSPMLWYRISVFRSFEARGAGLGSGSICFPPARRCLITQTQSRTRHGVKDASNSGDLPNPNGGCGKHRRTHTRTSPSRVQAAESGCQGRRQGASSRHPSARPVPRSGGNAGQARAPHGRAAAPAPRSPAARPTARDTDSQSERDRPAGAANGGAVRRARGRGDRPLASRDLAMCGDHDVMKYGRSLRPDWERRGWCEGGRRRGTATPPGPGTCGRSAGASLLTGVWQCRFVPIAESHRIG